MSRNRLRKIAKLAFFGSAIVIAAGYAAGVAWKMSGSEKWELEIDKGGVQVYTYKERGSATKQFKSVMRGKFTRSQIVAALMIDNASLDNCKAWIPTCVDLTVLEPFNTKAQGDAVLWTLEVLPPVFANREYSIKTHSAQDPQTGVVSIDVMAAPNKADLNDCCVRATHLHNRWQISPLPNGEVEVQLLQDFSMGGFFPDLLINLSGAEEAFKLFHDQLPKLIDKEKYKSAAFDYIAEQPTPREGEFQESAPQGAAEAAPPPAQAGAAN